MSRQSTSAVRIDTGSADADGVLLMKGDRLVAILVQLSDPIHGQACGRWSLEAYFGPSVARPPETFASIDQAWDWLERNETGAAWQIVGSRGHPFENG